MMNLVAALFAVDPSGLGGVALRAPAGAERDEWLALLKQLLPDATPIRRVPLNINDTALLGGLDLGATLGSGRPVAQQGVLASADGGVVVLAMAERVTTGTAARLAAVLDTHEVAIERDGVALRRPARLGVVALDEGMEQDEQVAASLTDRFAFLMQLQPGSDGEIRLWERADIAQARLRLPAVECSDDVVAALCAAASALGIESLRAPLLALKAARCAAALDGAPAVTPQHTALAARLVLAPRATRLPTSAQAEQPDAADNNPSDEDDEEHQEAPNSLESSPQPADESPQDIPSCADTRGDLEPEPETEINASQALVESVTAAARAAIPQGLLAALKVGVAAKVRAQAAGRSGAAQKNQTRGRPVGARRGEPRAGARLNVLETLRAAAPWQKLREQQLAQLTQPINIKRIHIRREDFHITRYKQASQTTTLFVVDASGSSALNRLAEAKGAVELLLADCYVRRDRVAVIAFRGKDAELLLPPTRSLARAKRSLAGLPGGGGTPLATAIDAARDLADQIKRKGETPIVVLLTDGRGNIARDGVPGRQRAGDDAASAARQFRFTGVTALLLDTSPQPQQAAQMLAAEMGAAYLPLPYAGAQALSRAVQLATSGAR